MSLSAKIQSAIEETINLYISEVSNKFDLDKNELLKLWDNKGEFKVNNIVTPLKEVKKDNDLLKLSKSELIEMCKAKALKVSGSKQDLVDRIINAEANKIVAVAEKKGQKTSPPIIKKLVEKIQNIHIKRNKFNNFEHEETSLVFNNKTQKVYGKQNPDGSVSDLTPEDINLCNKYKFAYYIPDNLDKKSNMKDVDLKELDDEEEVEEEVEEEYEEYEEEEEEEEFYEDD
jgi:hypothetical protein